MTITKRDGSTEAFSTAKLRRCVESLLRSSGFDAHLAMPLSKAVALHVERCDDDAPLTSDYLFDCVHAVLSQTGLRDAADRFRAHRDARRRSRERISIRGEQSGQVASVPWDKSRLVTTLRGQYGLRQSVSRYLASEIESKIIGLDYQNVSSELLNALVRSELSSWGLLDDRSVDSCGAVAGRPAEIPHRERED